MACSNSIIDEHVLEFFLAFMQFVIIAKKTHDKLAVVFKNFSVKEHN